MKSKKIKIQTILKKGTIVFLILTTLSSFLPIISVFAEEIPDNNEDSDYIISEDTEQITGIIIDEIDKLKEQLKDIDETFNYTNFIKSIVDPTLTYIPISNELELRALSIYVAEGNDCSDKIFKLTKNIVLTDTIEWNPIGDINNPFTGTIDGAGYTISGMLITIKQSYAGFVGYLASNGVIKNLTIGNSKISIPPEVDNKIQNDILSYNTVGYSYLSGLVGFAQNATITNCKNATNLNGGNIVGGIVGRAENTTIEYCSNFGKIQAYRTAGGIVGSYNSTVSTTEKDEEGNEIEKATNSISNCLNEGEIYAIIEGAGGISGTAWNKAIIKNCINKGTVFTAKEKLNISVYGVETIVSPQNAGGITSAAAFDENAGTIVIENCLNKGRVDGYRDIGGLVGQVGTGSGKEGVIGKTVIKNCINNFADFNNSDKVADEYKNKTNIGEFIGYAGVWNVPVTIENCYITTENEEVNSPNLSDYITGDKINAFGVIGGTKCSKSDCKEKNHPYEHIDIVSWTKEVENGDKKETITNLFHKSTVNAENEITDNVAPQFDEEKKVTIVNSGKSQSFAVKGDILTIIIPFDEPIRVGRLYPDVYINEITGIQTEYAGIDGSNLIFKYQVTGKENTSSFDIEKLIISGHLFDVFEKDLDLRSQELEIANYVKIISSNSENMHTHSVSYSNDEILYTISGFSKTTEDGKLYFDKESNIKIEAVFSGPLKHKDSIDVNINKEIPELHIETIEHAEWCVVDNGNYIKNENKIVYEFKAGEKAVNKELELSSLYLTSETEIEIDGEDFGKLTKENTGVDVSDNIYVDTISPKLIITTVVNNKIENNRYTIGEDILIKVTTDEIIDALSSERPEINVSFTNSGLGKYNTQGENATTGNAKYMETISNDDGTVTYKYRYTVQEGDEGQLKISCVNDEVKVYDIAGNIALTTKIVYNTDNMYVDTKAPTVQIKTETDIGNLTNANEVKYKFKFSEEVTGFDASDITVNGGIKGAFEGEGNVYYLTVTPTITDGNQGPLQVIVEADVCKDLVGYGNIRQESNITIDKVRPTLISYNIKEETRKIIIEAVFSEALSDASNLKTKITIGGNNRVGTFEKNEIFDNNKVRIVYNVAGADGGKVEVNLFGTVTDIAGNNSEELNVKVDNDITLIKKVIKDDKGNEYSFKKAVKGETKEITAFEEPTYFKEEESITVIKIDKNGNIAEYTYTIIENTDLSHMKYMTLTEPDEGETNGKVTLSNVETTDSINIVEANIWFDTIAPKVTTEVVANNPKDGIYTTGEELTIKATTSEVIEDEYIVPEIAVKFESNEGKFNNGKAQFIETVTNDNGTTTWVYRYVISEGDEGKVSLTYAIGEVIDLSGNDTSLTTLNSKENIFELNNITVDATAPTIAIEVRAELGDKYDVNGDSITDSKDIYLIREYIAKVLKDENIKQAIESKCDADGNGIVDPVDVTLIEMELNDDVEITNKSKLIYTFKFSEEVEGFTIEDITVNKGTKGEFKEIVKGKEYTLEVFTSVETGNIGDIQVIVEKNACQDKVGLSNVRVESVIRVDKRAPILIGLEAFAKSNISLDAKVDTVKQYYKVGDTVTIVATFDENIKEKTIVKPILTVQFSESGNAKGNVSSGIIEGNKITYTYTITEEDKGILSVKGFSGKVIDTAGNETVVTKRELSGDTIIADSISPKLISITAIAPNFKYDSLLSNEDETKRYGIGETITFITEYSKNIYNLTSNNIKVIDEATAPELKIEFGDTERIAKFDKVEGNKIYYTYTIGSEDNGNLSISAISKTVSDIVGSTLDTSKVRIPELNKYEENISEENKVEAIEADTRKPEITYSVSAVDYDDNGNVITGNASYYRKGSVITIKAETNEYVYKNTNSSLEKFTKEIAPMLNISFDTAVRGKGTVENVEYKDGKTIFTYTYTVKKEDNGILNLDIDELETYDIALNGNDEKTEEIDTIIADTIRPNYADQPGIEYVEGKGYTVQFNENLYYLDINNEVKEFKDFTNAPVLKFEGKEETYNPTVSGSIISYAGTYINAKPYLGASRLCDKAGNLYAYYDQEAPVLQKIEVISPETGVYKAGTEITIVATFNEKLNETSTVPTLTLQFADSKDTANFVDNGIIKDDTITYTYTIHQGDKGVLYAQALSGTGLVDLEGNEWIAPESVTLSGSIITADTEPPTVSITSDVEETNKDEVTYTFTWSEPVYGFTQDSIEVINGLKGTFDGKDGDTTYTLTVDSTNEGRQIVKVSAGVCKDIAGNLSTARATYNKVEIDYTKPTVRAKVNGGNFVIDTDSQKSTLKETIVVNEMLSKFEYAWSAQTDIANITEWESVDVSDIIVNSDINLSKEVEINDKESEVTYYLYLKVTDVAGNELKTRTKEFKVSKSAIKFEGILENPTKEDVIVTVKYGEGLTENRKAGISGKTQSADSTKVILSENGTVYAEATDEAGNKVYATQEVNNIDKTAPTAEIAYTENEDGSVTATITLSDGKVTNNNGETTYIFMENGEFTFEFEDALGNKALATAKVTTIKEVEVPVEKDKQAPTIIFSYTLTNNTVGNSIGATIITDEESKISYSWDNENWTTTENYVTSVNAVMVPTEEGTYILYAKAIDKAENESDVKTLEFIVVNSEEIKNPEIIFEDLTTLQIDGVRYVKVSADMTMDYITGKMNKEALCGKTPEYIKLTEDNKLRTGSEIAIAGKTKYIIVVNGDVNCDGEIKPIDVTLANRIRLDRVSSEVIQKIAADFDLSGEVEAIDITMINRYRLGKIKGI